MKPFSLHNAEYLAKQREIMFLGSGVGEAVAFEGSLKMKELTYLHCQSFSTMNIQNNFFGYINTKKGVPCVFCVVDDCKEETIQVMSKLLKHKIDIYPVIITDCTDEASQKFFLEFTGGQEK